VLDRDGRATVVNEAGPEIADASRLLSAFESLLGRARAVAFMGSLPPGLPPDVYATMIARTRERGRLSLLDTSGDALGSGLGAGPSLAKPNRAEAEELLGRELPTDADRREALRRLRGLGAEAAVLTLGKEGFLAANAEGVYRVVAGAGDLRLGNPTGAGDALAAGLLAGAVRGYPMVESARLAAAAAVASLAEGYGRFRPKDVRVEAVQIEREYR
jgi:fructose-1-phosphate kinase PfkB-like protein